jgi:thiol-disulfide isomerase/thioredoxin
MKKNILLALILINSLTVLSQTTLPKVELKNIHGEYINLENVVEKDQVLVVSLWATWCVPCINELDAIQEYYEDWQEETNFKLIAVSIDNSRTTSRVKPLVNGKEWDYEVLLDVNQDLKRALNANTVPYLIIVKNNKIVYSHSGYTPGSEIELYEKIKEFAQ